MRQAVETGLDGFLRAPALQPEVDQTAGVRIYLGLIILEVGEGLALPVNAHAQCMGGVICCRYGTIWN